MFLISEDRCQYILGKVLRVVFKQGEYERKLTDRLDFLRAQSSQFEKIANTSWFEIVEDMRASVKSPHTDASMHATELHKYRNVASISALDTIFYVMLRD